MPDSQATPDQPNVPEPPPIRPVEKRSIHPTAVIDPGAELAGRVEIGPYAVIENGVTVGDGTRIGPHVHIQGMTVIGENNEIGTSSTIGLAPQHLAYKGEPTELRIGNGNRIREYVSIHRAYKPGDATVIGNDCYLMGFSHVAHDCVLEDEVVLANNALIAGHAVVGRRTFISGFCAVHQFCHIGRLVMMGAYAGTSKDIPPFVTCVGHPAFITGLNSVGLKRAGLSAESRSELRRLFQKIFRSEIPAARAAAEIDAASLTPDGRELITFLVESARGVIPFKPYRPERRG